MGAIFAPTRFSLVRISIRDLVADGKSLVRKSGVGGGGQNRILTLTGFANGVFVFWFRRGWEGGWGWRGVGEGLGKGWGVGAGLGKGWGGLGYLYFKNPV